MLLPADSHALSKTALEVASFLARGEPATQSGLCGVVSCSQAAVSRALGTLVRHQLVVRRARYEPPRPRGRPTVTWCATPLLMAWLPNEGQRRGSRIAIPADDPRVASWIDSQLHRPVAITVRSEGSVSYLDGRLAGVTLAATFSVVLDTLAAEVRVTGTLGAELELGTHDLSIGPGPLAVSINAAPALP